MRIIIYFSLMRDNVPRPRAKKCRGLAGRDDKYAGRADDVTRLVGGR